MGKRQNLETIREKKNKGGEKKIYKLKDVGGPQSLKNGGLHHKTEWQQVRRRGATCEKKTTTGSWVEKNKRTTLRPVGGVRLTQGYG